MVFYTPFPNSWRTLPPTLEFWNSKSWYQKIKPKEHAETVWGMKAHLIGTGPWDHILESWSSKRLSFEVSTDPDLHPWCFFPGEDSDSEAEPGMALHVGPGWRAIGKETYGWLSWPTACSACYMHNPEYLSKKPPHNPGFLIRGGALMFF